MWWSLGKDMNEKKKTVGWLKLERPDLQWLSVSSPEEWAWDSAKFTLLTCYRGVTVCGCFGAKVYLVLLKPEFQF